MSMVVNRRDLDFILYETLDLESVLQSDRYAIMTESHWMRC
jgi:hypothetical protein